MNNYITLDGGTTNTRLQLIKEYQMIDTVRLSIGARNSIDNRPILSEAIKKGITDLLDRNHTAEQEILKILASGMITSEFGLYQIPHVEAPAGKRKLHDNMQEVYLPHISPIPFVFIPGVKINSPLLSDTDMMRGEETELYGLTLEPAADCAYILPGSHSKIIYTDAACRIHSFKTMLTGEMIAALSQNTILKDAVDLKSDTFTEEMLLSGYEYCKAFGINEALFKVRILKNLFDRSPRDVYSFFMGIVLCGEITSILNNAPSKIVIGGRHQIKQAMQFLLSKLSNVSVETISDAEVLGATSKGAIAIYEYVDTCQNLS